MVVKLVCFVLVFQHICVYIYTYFYIYIFRTITEVVLCDADECLLLMLLNGTCRPTAGIRCPNILSSMVTLP